MDMSRPMPVAEIRTVTGRMMDIEQYKEFIKKRTVTYPSEECTICLEPLLQTSKAICRLGCGHPFHHECIVNCCTRKCPFCRSDVDLSFPECGFCGDPLDPFKPTSTMPCCGLTMHTSPCMKSRQAGESAMRLCQLGCKVCHRAGLRSNVSTEGEMFSLNRYHTRLPVYFSELLVGIDAPWSVMWQLFLTPGTRDSLGEENIFEASAGYRGDEEPSGIRKMDKEFIDKLIVTDPSDKCTVCKESLLQSSKIICRLGCGHSFHHDCVINCCCSDNGHCPICKADVKLLFPECGYCEKRLHPFKPTSTMPCCGLTMHTLCLKSWFEGPWAYKGREMGCKECRENHKVRVPIGLPIHHHIREPAAVSRIHQLGLSFAGLISVDGRTFLYRAPVRFCYSPEGLAQRTHHTSILREHIRNLIAHI